MPLEKGKTACSDSSATETPIWFGYCILLAKARASFSYWCTGSVVGCKLVCSDSSAIELQIWLYKLE
jgi:hypothetical protein